MILHFNFSSKKTALSFIELAPPPKTWKSYNSSTPRFLKREVFQCRRPFKRRGSVFFLLLHSVPFDWKATMAASQVSQSSIVTNNCNQKPNFLLSFFVRCFQVEANEVSQRMFDPDLERAQNTEHSLELSFTSSANQYRLLLALLQCYYILN